MAEIKLSRFKYTWRGAWAPTASYNPDDVVSYGSKVYVCLETHTSTTDFYAELNFYNTDTPPLLVPKWVLMTEGATWKGTWQPDFYYKIGDTIKIGGSVYICLEGHTSYSKYILDNFGQQITNPADPTGEQGFFSADVATNKWTTLVNSQDWKIDWQPDTYYKVNDVVRYGGRVYKCNSSHISAASAVSGLESSIVQWDIINVADAWTGDWLVNTKYILNDIVKYGGNVYRCIVPHVSSLTLVDGLDADQGKWSLLHNGIEYKQSWTSGTIYKINDVVKYGSYTYKCVLFHLSDATFNISAFEIFCPGNEYDIVWNALTVYQPGDVVRYGGNLYSATQLQSNQSPDVSTTSWELLFQNSKIRETWQYFVTYEPGDVVRQGGNVYLALKDSLGQNPDLLDDGSTTNSEYWDLVVTGIAWVGVWQPNLTYATGDTVTWVSSSYKCIDSHFSENTNRPDDDSNHLYWEKITDGNTFARLRNLGDIRTFGPAEDGSTIDYTRLAIGDTGQALTTISGEAKWRELMSTSKVYFVSLSGIDSPENGTSPQSPWRTVRYALERITGYATLFVKTGVFEEVLPLRVPAFVAVVGDELRGTIIKPSLGEISLDYLTQLSEAVAYASTISTLIVKGHVIGTEDPQDAAFGTRRYGTVLQNTAGAVTDNTTALVVDTLFSIIKNKIDTNNVTTISGTNVPTTDQARLDAYDQLISNADFIKNETRLYVELFFADSSANALPERFERDLDRVIDAVTYDLEYIGNWKCIEAGSYFINAAYGDINKVQNMFLVRDGTGIRNMTLSGLDGELGPIGVYGTRRPTAGAYVSLDPGWGSADESAWVGSKSPYVQNVTTFGNGCVGLKIDGGLHAGGNQTIVCNDFTQILSDGIGIWANGTGRSEAVSVFTYYNHIGYLATFGGKIRGTNGNCSYGQFGAVSESYSISETPVTAVVNNRYYQASISQTLVNSNQQIMKLLFSHAGEQYTTATYNVIGSGVNASLIADEFRDGAVNEIRVVDPGDSTFAGGFGYTFNTNVSQGSLDNLSVILAGSDTYEEDEYRSLRIRISSGTGVGQYGYIAEYDKSLFTVFAGTESKPQQLVEQTQALGNLITVNSTTHLAINDPIIFTGTTYSNIENYTVYYVLDIISDSQLTISDTVGGAEFGLLNGNSVDDGEMVIHSLGWEHIVEGTPSVTVLDTTSNYTIEPRVTFSSPGFTTSGITLPSDVEWSSITASADVYVAVVTGSATAWTTTDGNNWNSVTLPAAADWSKVTYAGGKFFALSPTDVATSETGEVWSSITMPAVAAYTDIAYGNGVWVAVSLGGQAGAKSTDGENWTATTLTEGADWNSVEYGRGVFVATSLSDSTDTATIYSTDGTNWTASTFEGHNSISLAFGNNRFVSLSDDAEVAISFNGIDWTVGTIQAQEWTSVKYGQGLFVAVATNTNTIATSNDGLHWEYQTGGSSATWQDLAFANIEKPGKFIAISGGTSTSTLGLAISSGVTTQAIATVVAGRISAFNIWEPGSGYTSAPVMSITDPNNSSEVTTTIRIGNGVLGNPSIDNSGIGYARTTTTTTVNGDGFKEDYQLGSFIVLDNLTRLPGPGDNLTFSSINDYTYKVLSYEILSGTAPAYRVRLNIAKDLNRAESPEHGTTVEIRQLYSQVRLTGHDFLDIGLGNFLDTNYPNTLFPNGTVLAPEDEIREKDGGRVFYTSTDQDGNFRVGELFAVQQSTGIVTLAAQFFQLEGLEELRLGGIVVGGSGVVIREFSTDETFTADSNNVVPTQAAIKAYIQRRVSGGGADAITGQVVAGIVRVGPDQIDTTTGEMFIFPGVVNFQGGIDGTYLQQMLFMSGVS